MVVLLSAAVAAKTTCGINPKLQDENFCICQWKPRSNTPFFSGLSKKKNCEVLILRLAGKSESVVQTAERGRGKIMPRKAKDPIVSEGRDEDEEYGRHICPGCGIFMQDKDLNLPGYYQARKANKTVSEDEEEEYIENEVDGYGLDDGEEEEEFENGINEILEGAEGRDANSEGDNEFDWELDALEAKFLNEEVDVELDGFAPAGVGYGNVTEETIEKGKKKRLSKAEKNRMAREEARKERDDLTVCARCHSLRNYGQVKNPVAENLIPDFDFDRLISTRLIKPMSNAGAAVVVMVVDCADFDGSFPKRAANSLFKVLQKSESDPKLSKKLPKLVLVATKVDLLPSQVSPSRLDRWVRQRAKAGGAPKLSGVYLVSARKDLGVRNLLTCIKDLAGPRGSVWVIGAQNAGKSTLINVLSKKERAKVTRLTEAPVPGTTLGILRIEGVLPAKAKMYDTPGLLHPYLMSMILNPDERKMIEIRKELQPRTYRVKASYSI